MDGAAVFFTSGGGSDAVDTAAKLARRYWNALGRPEKQIIISREHGYHGTNAFGTSLQGIPANRDGLRRPRSRTSRTSRGATPTRSRRCSPITAIRWPPSSASR